MRSLRGVVCRFAVLSAWIAVAGVLVVMVPSWLGMTLSNWHAGMQLFTPWLALVVSGALLVAVATTRRALAIVAGLLVVAVAVPLIPMSVANDASKESGPELRVYVANLYVANPTLAEALDQVIASDADVLVLTEFTQAAATGLDERGVDDWYPHQLLDPADDPFGSAIYSRLPLTDRRLDRIDHLRAPSAHVNVEGQDVLVVAVHTWAPILASNVADWDAQLGSLTDFARDLPTPTVLAGDFNATRWHPGFRELVDLPGLGDAHEDLGLGLSASWPAEGHRLGFIGTVGRLDHALVHDLTPTSIDEWSAAGSDHRPFMVTMVAPSSEA